MGLVIFLAFERVGIMVRLDVEACLLKAVHCGFPETTRHCCG